MRAQRDFGMGDQAEQKPYQYISWQEGRLRVEYSYQALYLSLRLIPRLLTGLPTAPRSIYHPSYQCGEFDLLIDLLKFRYSCHMIKQIRMIGSLTEHQERNASAMSAQPPET